MELTDLERTLARHGYDFRLVRFNHHDRIHACMHGIQLLTLFITSGKRK